MHGASLFRHHFHFKHGGMPMKLLKTTSIGFLLTTFCSSFAIAQASLDYSTTIDANNSKGVTYFTFMAEQVKPQLDRFAKRGFEVADGRRAVAVLDLVGKKVSTGAMRAAHTRDAIAQVADALHGKGAISFYDLPAKIGKANPDVSRYDLTTYLALASGGGVAVKLNDSNVFYNVNYGAGDVEKDEMTGRSFAATPLHNADDISDKNYLRDLESYVRGSAATTGEFYRLILEGLVDCDFSQYSRLSKLGQSVATDFFAIYTAEQDRHMMANLESHPWDVALMEVTLLSAVHAGQDKIALFFNGKMSDVVANQERCTSERNDLRDASLIDYWQFTTNPDPRSCGRSGINITKKEFRALGKVVSDYEREHNPSVVQAVERHFRNVKTGGNVFAELSGELINAKAPRSMGRDGDALVNDMLAFLAQVQRDANEITRGAQK